MSIIIKKKKKKIMKKKENSHVISDRNSGNPIFAASIG